MGRVAWQSEAMRQSSGKLKALLLELPSLCTGFFRSIGMNTSVLTRLGYAYDLRLFFDYLSKEEADFDGTEPRLMTAEHMQRVTARHIEGFQDYLQYYVKMDDATPNNGEPRATAVTNREPGIMRKLSALSSLFDYLFRNEIVLANVATLVHRPKNLSKPILFMEENEVQRMMDALESGEEFSNSQRVYLRNTKARDTAILMLFLGPGIRVSELVGLDTDHIDFSENSFLVTRKGGNQTILYFPNPVEKCLKNYLAQREKMEAQPGHEHALFLSLQKRRITQRAVENLVKKYATLGAPLKKKLSPHKLRSTFGTNLYRETGDIYLVADTLGHADVNTTRKHYAAMADSKRREAAKRIKLPETGFSGAENE